MYSNLVTVVRQILVPCKATLKYPLKFFKTRFVFAFSDMQKRRCCVLCFELKFIHEFQKKSETPLNVEVAPAADETLPIPRPDTVPQRKSSIIYPSVHSKLSPIPHIHHSAHDTDPLPES